MVESWQYKDMNEDGFCDFESRMDENVMSQSYGVRHGTDGRTREQFGKIVTP